jgi:hypothetical protein
LELSKELNRLLGKGNLTISGGINVNLLSNGLNNRGNDSGSSLDLYSLGLLLLLDGNNRLGSNGSNNRGRD